MNNALQAYNVMASPTPDDTPQQPIILVHTNLIYHIAQANQAQHGSLVDRGANGGLADSDGRISPSLPGSTLSLALANPKPMVLTLCNVLHWLIQNMAMLTSS